MISGDETAGDLGTGALGFLGGDQSATAIGFDLGQLASIECDVRCGLFDCVCLAQRHRQRHGNDHGQPDRYDPEQHATLLFADFLS